MRTFFGIVFLLIINQYSFTQGIAGTIKDKKGNPISLVTIYIQELQTGTTANQNGQYELSLVPGKYTLSFTSIGYKKIIKEAEVTNGRIILDVTLPGEIYQIKEIVVNKGAEDPAYAIMRKVIALAPYHLNEVSHYRSNVYLRGTVYIDNYPKFFSKHTEVVENNQRYNIKSGDVFVEESVIDIVFHAPSLYKQTVRSVRNSLPSGAANPSNPAMVIASSFYQPQIMELISPLSPQAFQHYKFRYDGFIQDGDFFISKINVIPRRKSQELFQGYLYIVDGKWCIYSVDLTNTQFWGTLHIKEMFANTKSETWMPISYNFNVNAQLMGVKARYKYTSSVKYDSIRVNENLRNPLESKTVSVQKGGKKQDSILVKEISETLSKDNISFREMRKIARKLQKENALNTPDTISQKWAAELTKFDVDSLANKRDSTYWNKMRPIPLTNEEITSFKEGPFGVMKHKDTSLQSRDTSSVNKKKNKMKKYLNWIVDGKTFGKKNSRASFHYKGLLQLNELSFNTVDGIRYGLTSTFYLKIDSLHKLNIQPWVGYGFSRKAWMWEIKTSIPYSTENKKKGTITFSYGRKDFDFNSNHGIRPFINSTYTLFVKDNYLKLYQSEFADIQNEINIHKQLRLSMQARHERLNELDNHTDYSFFNPYNKTYSPNIPPNPLYTFLEDDSFRNFIFRTWLTFTPGRAKTRNPKSGSAPTFTLSYTGGFPDIFHSRSDFHNVGFSANQQFNLSYHRRLSYHLAGNYWISNKEAWFSSFTHMKTSYIPIAISGLENYFQLLPYYMGSTNKWNIEGHIKYSTHLLLLKRLPFISNRIWNENLYLNYLYTPAFKNYTEAGYTLGQILVIGEIGCFVSFENLKYRSFGIKVCIKLQHN